MTEIDDWIYTESTKPDGVPPAQNLNIRRTLSRVLIYTYLNQL